MKFIAPILSYLPIKRLLLCLVLITIIACEATIEYEIVFENIIPKGLPSRAMIFSFATDSIGYASTQYYDASSESAKYMIYKTVDSGLTWSEVYQGDGWCHELYAQNDGRLYFLEKMGPQYGDAQTSIKCMVNMNDVQVILHSQYSLCNMHVYPDNAIFVRKATAVDQQKDSLLVRYNAQAWKAIPLPGTYEVAYGLNHIFAPSRNPDPDRPHSYQLHAINRNSLERSIIASGAKWSIMTASENLLSAGSHFYRFDTSQLHVIGMNKWNGDFSGRYIPTCLLAKGELAIASTLNYPGKTDKMHALTYTFDSGKNWESLLIGDYVPDSFAEIPSNDGIAIVFYGEVQKKLSFAHKAYSQISSDGLHILRIRKKN